MRNQIASFLLQLVDRAPINGADAENTSAAKSWLRQIAKGELVVGAPVPEPKPAEPAEPAK